MIASLVLGLDDDGRDDIRRSVDFAKSIDAYQIQPAILTPFPQTPVYQQLCSEGRMIPGDWDRFDMTNVTFQPKQLSPWELQEEFARAGNVFYDFPSALRIGKLFGIEYFWRRFYLAAATSLGPGAMHFVADHVPQSYYYVLKHTPWMFAPEATPEATPAAAYARTAVDREDGDMISGLSEHLRRGVRQLESTAEIVTAGVMNIARITGRLLQSISQGPISTVSDSSTAKNSISATAPGDGAAKGALPLSHIASLASLQESRRPAVQKQLDDFKALNARIEDANARIRQADQRIEVQVEVLGKTIRDRVDPPRMIAIPTN